MGVPASKPDPRAELQVIGAGLPRTGTASFAMALSTLLKGPVYHGGAQTCTSGDDTQIKRLTKLLRRTPYRSAADREFVLRELRGITQGYVAVVDAPFGQFVPELMEIYPSAVVICTVRDPDAWAKSIDAVSQTSLQSMLGFFLFWLPALRHFPEYIDAINDGRWAELYANPGQKGYVYGKQVWERHVNYLRRSVPTQKLMWYDVRDGWGPLCKQLGLPVPEETFPRINDGRAIDVFAKSQIKKGLTRWVYVGIGLAVLAACTAHMCRSWC